jgi:hypothetical protein
MRGVLESIEEEDITVTFLRHALMVINGFIRKESLYDEVQRLVRSEPSALTFVSRLETLANAYVACFNPGHQRWNEYDPSVRRSIEVFNLLDVKPMRALILAISSSSKMNKVETLKSLRLLISLSVRLLIASSTRSGSVEEPIANAAHAVGQGEITTAAQLKDNLKRMTPTDEEFRRAFEDARVSNGKLARYYLRSLEMEIKGVKDPWFIPQDDHTLINVEHVLPRRPSGNWPQFDEEIARSYVNRFGNLVLMKATENSSLRSDTFSAKRPIYSSSPYELTSQVASYDEWTAASIADRQRKLAELAVQTWPI